MRLIVKNWRDFQHYDKRRPPWIKLHRGLLDDYEFQCLPVASRALAPMLWLLASESDDGAIEYDIKKLGFRLRMSDKELTDALKPLIEKEFFGCEQDASTPLATIEVSAHQERETERETYKEEKEKRGALAAPSDVSPGIWSDFNAIRKAKKAPITPTALAGIRREADKAGVSLDAALRVCCERGWQSFKADWVPKSQEAVLAEVMRQLEAEGRG